MMRRSPVRARAGVHPPLAFHACVAPAVQLEDLVDGGHRGVPGVVIASVP